MKAYLQKGRIEAGCDEAGRGCLAGPVFAAAVILPSDFPHQLMEDSKKLSSIERTNLRRLIEREALDWAVAHSSPKEIDRINILNASFAAMHRAIRKLKRRPDHLLIDGNRFNPIDSIPFNCIVKGDGIYASIAAASILAKTHRDEYMTRQHSKYPQYNWDQNKGYPTPYHRQAIAQNGHSVLHRRSFKLYPDRTLFDQE